MSAALRVLHIGNGAARKIHAILRGLERRGHEMHMVPVPPSAPALDGVVWHSGDTTARLPSQLRVLNHMRYVRRLVRQLRPHVVHAHNAWGPGWYGAAAGAHPFVIHAYGGDVLPEQYAGRGALQRRLTSWTCRAADRIIVTGQHMVAATRHLGIEPAKVVVLPRGVDVQCFRPGLDVSGLRAELGLADAAPVVLSPRYQVDEALYNLDVVVEAFAAVRRQLPRAVCLQMHEPTRRAGAERLRAAAAERGLGDSYRLLPVVGAEKMAMLYNLADVVVSTPSSDGFPVTVLEASACERPIVVAELPYCEEWFVDGENGCIVPQRDAAALASRIVELATDDELRRRIGAAGRRLVCERADYEKCMDALEELYRRLLGERNSNAG